MIKNWIASNIIFQLGYDEKSETLEVEFKNKEIYNYYLVPNEVYNEFMKSGQERDNYFKEKIEKGYQSTRIY